MDVLVAGGTGFVGRALCRALADRGHAVTAASRSPDDVELPAAVETAQLDVTDDDLVAVVEGHEAVVNLVALPSHVQPSGPGHDAVHREGTRNLVTASEATDVGRFVQMSGLGVDTGVDTAYLEAKRAAEDVVRESALDWVLFRPSVVFGDGCAFLPFLRRLTVARIVPLPDGGRMRIQPIWVGDLVRLLADGLDERRHVGECYEIGGPEPRTLAETVRLVRPGTIVVPLPSSLARVAFAAAEWLPLVPFGRDQYRVHHLDNTVDTNDVTTFGLTEDELHTLEAYLDDEAVPDGNRTRLDRAEVDT